jgi:hypothetical protein
MEVKERLGRVEAQFKEWDVSRVSEASLAVTDGMMRQTENELRRHNYVGLVCRRSLPCLPSLTHALS